jgi:hypothetical protein
MGRIWESVIATVIGGLIVWSVTGSMPKPQPGTNEKMAVAAMPAAPTARMPNSPPALPTIVEAPLLPAVVDPPPLLAVAGPPLPAAAARPMVPTPAAKKNLLPYSVAVGSLLMYENFSRYGDGDAADWGSNTFIKTGLDRRKWLVSNVEGWHPVGCRIRLPREFYVECRYSAYMPEVTRGLVGWWKEPVSTKIALLSDQGAKYSIEWIIRCGNDPLRLNPIGSSSLYAKKYYHTITLPDGTAGELGVVQPTGMLRIDRDNNAVKVLLDGQVVVAGNINAVGQFAGFEIDVVNVKNGTLFFTDFKVGR